MTIVTTTPIEQVYVVRDITTTLNTYDSMRWYRSRGGKSGLYEAATAASASGAILDGSLEEPHELNGKTLSVEVDGTTQVDVTFATADPVSTADAASEINGATGLITASDENGYLRLTSGNTGSAASLKIIESDAAPFLGFQTGDAAVGLDADTTLASGTSEYTYTDGNSAEDFWYKVKFINTSPARESLFSAPFPSNPVEHVPLSDTITGYIWLADLEGRPIKGRKITLTNQFLPNVKGKFALFRNYKQITTDKDGYAEARLVKDATIDFGVEGTGFVRRIKVPDTGDKFDLLDPSLVTTDEFGIHEQNIDFAIRLS